MNELKSLGLEPKKVTDFVVNNWELQQQFIKIAKVIVTIIVVFVLFFISYFIIRIILKSRLSSSIFAGNFLNILTIVFLKLFFCFFKNCTDIYTIFMIIPL